MICSGLVSNFRTWSSTVHVIYGVALFSRRLKWKDICVRPIQLNAYTSSDLQHGTMLCSISLRSKIPSISRIHFFLGHCVYAESRLFGIPTIKIKTRIGQSLFFQLTMFHVFSRSFVFSKLKKQSQGSTYFSLELNG